MQGPCLLEALVKETLCLEASTDPLPKRGLGSPLCMLDRRSCGCLESVQTCCSGLDEEMKDADLDKFKGRVSLSVDPHLSFSSSPVSLSLSFTQLPPVLHAAPLCLRLSPPAPV